MAAGKGKAIGLSGSRIEITKISDPTFGFVLAGTAGRQFILGTNSAITGTHATQYVSGAMAGSLQIKAIAARPTSIYIAATSLSTSGGVTSTTIYCSYDAMLEVPCNSGGFTVSTRPKATLLIGLDMLTNQAHLGGDVGTVSFDIEITNL